MKQSAKFFLASAFVIALACFRLTNSSAQVQTGTSGKDAPPDGAKLYAERCAVCHDNAQDRIPPKNIIARRAPDEVMTALTTGSMKTQASGLKPLEIRAIAVYLTGKEPTGVIDPSQLANRCQATAAPINLKAANWNGWGLDSDNTRFQPKPGLKAEDVPKLKVKWAFAHPGTMATGQPTLIGDRLFLTTEVGIIYSLNAQTGCTYWTMNAGAAVRAAMS
ncbi:MAG: c-type cytochrome, partial [Blastocatellia bacterium]